MEERRKLERKPLAFFTRLFDRETGQLLGNLDNLTAEGAMVICEAPLEVGRVYRLHMELPEAFAGRGHLSFEAVCIWCRADAYSSRFYNAGLNVTRIQPQDLELVERITRQYTLRSDTPEG